MLFPLFLEVSSVSPWDQLALIPTTETQNIPNRIREWNTYQQKCKPISILTTHLTSSQAHTFPTSLQFHDQALAWPLLRRLNTIWPRPHQTERMGDPLSRRTVPSPPILSAITLSSSMLVQLIPGPTHHLDPNSSGLQPLKHRPQQPEGTQDTHVRMELQQIYSLRCCPHQPKELME